MKVETYKGFAIYMLSDVAERRDSRGQKVARGQRREECVAGERRRLGLLGDDIWYAPGNERFRDSDCSFRLTMAVRAFEKIYEQERRNSRGGKWWAAVQVARLILTVGSPRLRARFLKGKRGPKAKPRQVRKLNGPRFRLPIGEDRDARFAELDRMLADGPKRRPRAPKLEPEVERLARIIRSQVAQFQHDNQDYTNLFDFWLSTYRAHFSRDAERYSEAELEYRSRIRAADEALGLHHELTARHTLNLAVLLHEQRRFSEAEEVYRLALERWKSNSAIAEVRDSAILLICRELNNCSAGKPPTTCLCGITIATFKVTRSGDILHHSPSQ